MKFTRCVPFDDTNVWPISYRKYILQITQPSQYGYLKLQYRFAVTSVAPSSMSCICYYDQTLSLIRMDMSGERPLCPWKTMQFFLNHTCVRSFARFCRHIVRIDQRETSVKWLNHWNTSLEWRPVQHGDSKGTRPVRVVKRPRMVGESGLEVKSRDTSNLPGGTKICRQICF